MTYRMTSSRVNLKHFWKNNNNIINNIIIIIIIIKSNFAFKFTPYFYILYVIFCLHVVSIFLKGIYF